MAEQGTIPLGVQGPPRGAGLAFGLVAVALAVAAVVGVFFVFKFVAAERERDLRVWQDRLAIVAESRLAAVNDWIEQQYATLKVLAENAALQIYMTELALAEGDREKVTAAAAQAGYLRNLLIVTAARGRFTGRPAGPEVDANVKRVGVAGIALVDNAGRVLVSTPDMPPLEGALKEFVASVPKGARALTTVLVGPAGTPSMAFSVPVFAVQADANAAQQVGSVLGLKEVDAELFPLLRQPGAVERTAETLLVEQRGAVIEYLSPQMDGTPALTRKGNFDDPTSAEAFALRNPGGFAIKTDYRGEQVLVTGRKVAATPWMLVHKIDRAEALAESDARLRRLLATFLLSIGLVGASVLAAWWHGSSRRAREAAASFAALANRFENQGKFLQLITDSQPDVIFIVDEEQGRLRFANRAAAERAAVAAADLVGKTLAAAFGPEEAKRYARHNREAFEKDAPVFAVERIVAEGRTRVVQTQHIPLPATATEPRRVLVVERDVTTAVLERERRERILRQLVSGLLAAVDRRDPFAANHSLRVGMVARAIAEEMGLDPVSVETAEFAGSLMNLGKILVPETVLTKTGRLSDEEMQRVRESIRASADFIAGIEFDGPVVDTLRQLLERWDGTGGPKGLKGEEILITARIVAVANAFVAMVSPRAYRAGIGFDAAIDNLLSQVGKAFDRRVVAALVHYLDNRGGRERWADFARPPRTG